MVEELTNSQCRANQTSCRGIKANSVTGEYGAYSMCEPYQRLSWQLNLIHLDSNPSRACNISANPTMAVYINSREPTTIPTCSAFLSQAGPLGDKTINYSFAAAATNFSSTSTSSTPSATGEPTETTKSGASTSKVLSSGAIAGTAIGIVAVLAILVGFFLLWRKRKQSKDAAEGLEVGNPPAGYEYVRNVELDSKSRKSELPVPKERPLELPGGADVSQITTLKEAKTDGQEDVENANNKVDLVQEQVVDIEATNESEDGRLIGLNAEEQLAFVSATAHEGAEESFSPSWAGGNWYDPNDPRQGMTGNPPLGAGKSRRM